MIFKYILRRLLSAIPVLIGITILAFLLGILSPGDPAEIALNAGGEFEITEEQLAAVRAEMGLDKPYIEQYINWLTGVFHGDWGISFRTKNPVSNELWSRFSITVKLSVCAMVLTVIFGILGGIICAAYKKLLPDKLLQWLSTLFLSSPNFWLAIIFINIFSERLHWLPTSGQSTWKHMIMPTVVLSISTIGTTIRLTRSSMIRELGSQYIIAANSKGISQKLIMMRHALSNSIIPVITLLGNYFGGILGGAAIIESIFAINGIGKFALDSIAVRDYPALQGYVLITGFTFVLINLAVDLAYYFFNPQIRLGGGRNND